MATGESTMDSVLDHPRYDDLVAALDASGGWRALGTLDDGYGRLLSAEQVAAAARQPSPADFLVRQLFEQLGEPCSASDMVDLLEHVGQPAAAALVAPPRPLRVRPLAETNGPRVWAPLGGRLLLHCDADAAPPPTFVWRRDGVALAGCTAAALALQPFAAADAGVYSCEVRAANGAAVDAGAVAVELAQTPPLEATRGARGGDWGEDGAVLARADRPLELAVTWEGWPPPELRWERDGTPLPAAGAVLTLRPGPELVDGRYVCVAANAVGEVRSEPFVVVTEQRPVILTHPQVSQKRQVVDRQLLLTSSAFCRRPMQAIWRLTYDDRDVLVPAGSVRSEPDGRGALHSELRLTPAEAEVRKLCRVTCEFVPLTKSGGDFVNRSQSRPAVFRVVYAARSKMALIIGNSRYSYCDVLPKVNDDVAAFRAKMVALGFGTLVTMNLSTERAWREIRYFARLAAPGSYLVVLVAGHGFTHQRRNYLAPVDHPRLVPPMGFDRDRCLWLEAVQSKLQERHPAALVRIGDFCRSELQCASPAVSPPLPPAAGPPVAGPLPATNTLCLFSTQVGYNAWDDGRFMSRLLENIEKDITLQELGVQTLRMQTEQPPMLETTLQKYRSLLDIADNQTPLDVCVTGRHYRICRDLPDLGLEFSWSNYVWMEERELLLTLGLKGPSAVHGDIYVKTVLERDGKVVFKLERGDQHSLVSTWRVTRLPAVRGTVAIRPVIMLVRPDEEKPIGYQLGEQQLLQLGPHGLEMPPGARPQPPEPKLLNVDGPH